MDIYLYIYAYFLTLTIYKETLTIYKIIYIYLWFLDNMKYKWTFPEWYCISHKTIFLDQSSYLSLSEGHLIGAPYPGSRRNPPAPLHSARSSLNAQPNCVHNQQETSCGNRRPVGRPPGEAVVVEGKEPDFELSKYGFQVLPFLTGSIPHHSKTQNKTTKTLF